MNAAEAVAIEPDEKIVVTGTIDTSPGPKKVGVWRLEANGSLDPEFGSGGTVEISDGHEDTANAIALAPEGKIVVAGSTTDAVTPTDAVAWRLTAAGALDTTFDTDGQADVDDGGSETANAVAVQPDGKIVMAGSSSIGAHGGEAVVWRLKPNGGPGAHEWRARPDVQHGRRSRNRRRRLRERESDSAAARRQDPPRGRLAGGQRSRTTR